MTQPTRTPPSVILLLALAYFALGRLGLMLPAFGSTITLIWLPTGIAVASLLRWGFGCWPGVVLGAVTVNMAVGVPLPAALGMAVGNTCGTLLTAWALRRVGLHPAFDRRRDILFLAGAAIVGMAICASAGITSLALAGVLPDGRLAAWLTWWAGDTMGVIAAAPLVLAFTRKEVQAILVHRAEFALWLGATVLVIWGVFVLNRGSDGQAWALAFVPLPLVAWAALRYGPVGTSVALIVISVVAAYGTATGHGPFYRPQPIEGVVVLWIFMATAAALGWLISALQAARVQATGVQQLFEQALTDVSLGVLLAGLDRRITYANQGFTRLTGYTEAELLGKSCAILQGPETAPGTGEKLKAALQDNGFFDGEILNYRKDGTTFWNALLISPVHDERGHTTGFLGIQRDITKRKHAELALSQSEEHLRQIIEIEPECVKILSPEGTLLEMNPAGLAMIEATSFDQVRGCPLGDLIVPEHRADFAEMHERAMAGGTGRCEFAIKTLKGTPRWLETHAVPYRNGQRAIVGVLGITRDVTQRKEAEEAVRESEARFRRLIDYAPEAVMLLDIAAGRFVQVNSAAERLFKLAAVELCQVGPAQLSPPTQPDGRPSSEKAAEFVSRAIAGETPVFEWTHRDSEGRDIPTEVRLLRLDLGGRVVVRGSTTDITERKRAEEERTHLLHSLEESQVRLQTLVRNLPGMAYRCLNDPNWTMSYVSEGCEAVTSYGRDELENNRTIAYADLIHADDRDWLWAKCQKSLDARTPCQNEYRILDRQGRERWVSERASGVYAEDGALLAIDGFIQDITAARQAKIEREQLDRKMQETQKLESLGVLAGGIAHDFNNLLTAILGNASIAQIELPPGSSVQDCLEQINEASLRAADLCKQMLAYSGRGRFVVQKLDLGELVEQTAQMLQISISKKSVLRYRLEKGLPPVEVDATQLRQVIMNLVINASEAIGNASGVISVSTGLTRVDRHYLHGTLMDPDLPEGDYVFLEVSDSGCGMSAETQARIFDPFFTTKFTGRGLGLAAVLGIVRGHKGAMKVYSEVGRGTTFKLLFPAATGANETASERPAASVGWQAKGTVLVVDDEETMRSTISRMMRIIGLEPVLASDGREAIEIFRSMPDEFVLVLLDLTMPHLDGEQTFTELRRLRPEVRVVLMSGFNAQEALVRFPGKGLASFLQKPFTISSLSATLKEVLDKNAPAPSDR